MSTKELRCREGLSRVLASRRRLGPFGILLYTGHDRADPLLARRSMELMAHEFWPRVTHGLA
jgi:hypothetical protein